MLRDESQPFTLNYNIKIKTVVNIYIYICKQKMFAALRNIYRLQQRRKYIKYIVHSLILRFTFLSVKGNKSFTFLSRMISVSY